MGIPLFIFETENIEGTSVVHFLNLNIIKIISSLDNIPKVIHIKKGISLFKVRVKSIKKASKVSVHIFERIEWVAIVLLNLR